MDASETAAPRGGAWADELTDLARAATGGSLLGIPLLYTMEMWWAGARSEPWRNLFILVVSLALVIVLQRTAGFRSTRDSNWGDAVVDAVKVVALSALIVTVVLVILRQITTRTPVPVAVGKVLHQTFAFSIGASVARQFLSEARGDDDEAEDADDRDDADDDDAEADESDLATARLDPTVADIGATIIGAAFVGLSIAPTDEVPMLVTALDPFWLILVVVMSLVVSYSVVFVAGFSGQRQRHAQQGLFQHPVTETVMCYLVSLVCAGAMLRLFFDVDGDWTRRLSMVIVLGLPASVGGSAGRLAI